MSSPDYLSCPTCDYNLTGLALPRCPECGQEFDWDRLRDQQSQATIAFEQARGWRKIGGFLTTWTTVLFAPWVFARQVVRKASIQHASIFGAICFNGPAFACAASYSPGGWTNEAAILLSWLLSCILQIVLQGLLLAAIDPDTRQPFRARFGLWIAVGGYTSAIVITEFFGTPPFLEIQLHRLPEYLSELAFVMRNPDFEWPRFDLIDLQFELGEWQWAQLVLWLAGPLCVLWQRFPAERRSRLRTLLTLLFAMAAILLLYGLIETYATTGIYMLTEDFLPD